MENVIHLFFIIPLVGFVLSLLVNNSKEAILSQIAFYTIGTNLLFTLGFSIYWLFQGGKSINLKEFTVYNEQDYNFFIDFFFDRITATYIVVGTIITFMVVKYSRFYLHKDPGYKRYFNTILFFYIGYVLTVMAGNFETLFVGWEILGLSSFLLIAFYRLRYLPVKNAIRVFTIYRIGDIGILLAMWMSHHLWSDNVTFFKLHNYELVHQQLESHSDIGIFISLMILIAATAKSAQLPFSAWLPRAMEGPTPSSAIFYGSLSVHIGAFLLMRTHPFWEHQVSIRWLIAIIGLSTAIITTLIGRVQSTIKGKIAYSSAAQIGFIFVEIAAGLEVLALIHFAGNAFLRTYQLLISPSVITYLIREQFYNYEPSKDKEKNSWIPSRIKNAIFILSLKEWHLESVVFRLIFMPLKKLERMLHIFKYKSVVYLFILVYIIGIYIANSNYGIPHNLRYGLAIAAGIVALLMVAKAYNERSNTLLAWTLVVFAHFYIDLAVTLNDHVDIKEATLYLSGITISGLLGYFCLKSVGISEHNNISLNKFHGFVTKHKLLGFVFLLSCLGIAGFPITTSFLGEDLILTHIHEKQVALAALVSLTFIINGIAVIRIYSRIFLGHYSHNFQNSSDLSI